jgi:hypothetical protein
MEPVERSRDMRLIIMSEQTIGGVELIGWFMIVLVAYRI